MDNYVLTAKGKWALGCFISVLILGIVLSGSYIIAYFDFFSVNNATGEVVNLPPKTEPEGQVENNIVEVETSVTNENPLDEPTEVSEVIYSEQDLKELKSYIITLHYDSDTDQLAQESETLLDGLLRMLEKYPKEKVTVQTYVNGYPSFLPHSERMKISVARGISIINFFSDKGLAVERFNVYNFGAEVSLYKEEHRQYENDRINVFFTDHYISLPATK